MLRLHTIIVIVAVSYLTLCLSAPAVARALWWPYAIVAGALGVISLVQQRRSSDRPRQQAYSRTVEKF